MPKHLLASKLSYFCQVF